MTFRVPGLDVRAHQWIKRGHCCHEPQRAKAKRAFPCWCMFFCVSEPEGCPLAFAVASVSGGIATSSSASEEAELARLREVPRTARLIVGDPAVAWFLSTCELLNGGPKAVTLELLGHSATTGASWMRTGECELADLASQWESVSGATLAGADVYEFCLVRLLPSQCTHLGDAKLVVTPGYVWARLGFGTLGDDGQASQPSTECEVPEHAASTPTPMPMMVWIRPSPSA